MLPPLAIVFDLDGTLVDSLRDIADAVNAVLVDAGMAPHPREAYRDMIGGGLSTLVRRAMTADGDFDRLLEAARRRYGQHCMDATSPYPGIPELLAELSERGVPLAVLSNKPHAMTLAVVERMFPKVAFAAVIGDRAGVPRKPDPGSAEEILQILAVAPDRCPLVGDMPVDIETAHAASMPAVAVSWGYRSAAQLRPHRPSRIIDRPGQLLDLFGA